MHALLIIGTSQHNNLTLVVEAAKLVAKMRSEESCLAASLPATGFCHSLAEAQAASGRHGKINPCFSGLHTSLQANL